MPTSKKNITSLEEWLNYLLAIHPTEIDMGLKRVKLVAERLNLLKLKQGDSQKPQIVTVAGTNGKGTTCKMLESILQCSDLRVGVYTSPHIIKYNERIRVCGIDATDQDIITAFSAIELARKEISLTFFEFATLAALYIFREAKLDVIILEVGLGGRLDATNIIDADISVITAIDLDHQDYLGNTRNAIGLEKAGILRSNQTAVIGEPRIPQSVVDFSHENQIPLYAVGQGFSYLQTDLGWDFTGETFDFKNLVIPSLPLPNAATVLAILERLKPILWHGFTQQDCMTFINNGLQQAHLEGRFERISSSPVIYLDVAHNPHAARYLASKIKQLAPSISGKVYGFCGMLKDKDISGVINELLPVIDEWYLTALECERGASKAQITDAFLVSYNQFKETHHQKDINHNCFSHLNSAWQELEKHLVFNDMVIIFGSFYTVSGAKLLIGRK